jgi:hypothetical protein
MYLLGSINYCLYSYVQYSPYLVNVSFPASVYGVCITSSQSNASAYCNIVGSVFFVFDCAVYIAGNATVCGKL